MRNLEKYPITKDEVDKILEVSVNYYLGKGYIGDTEGYSLSLIREFLKDNQEFEIFLKSKEIKNV